MDGCSSPYSPTILQAAEDVQFVLSDATHLIQPLDIAVLGSFKARLRALLNGFIGDDGYTTSTKAMAVQLAGLAWQTCNFSTNVASDLRSSGCTHHRSRRWQSAWANFERNGASKEAKVAAWLKVKDVTQNDRLILRHHE